MSISCCMNLSRWTNHKKTVRIFPQRHTQFFLKKPEQIVHWNCLIWQNRTDTGQYCMQTIIVQVSTNRYQMYANSLCVRELKWNFRRNLRKIFGLAKITHKKQRSQNTRNTANSWDLFCLSLSNQLWITRNEIQKLKIACCIVQKESVCKCDRESPDE